MKSTSLLAAGIGAGVTALLLCTGVAAQSAQTGTQKQLVAGFTDVTNRPQQGQNNNAIRYALSHTVRVPTTGGLPGGFADGSHSAIIVVLRKQRARALIGLLRPNGALRGARGSTDGGTLLRNGAGPITKSASTGQGSRASQTGMLLKPGSSPALKASGGSIPQIGASRTMSSQTQGSGSSPTPAHSQSQTAPSVQQAPDASMPAHPYQPPPASARAPLPSRLCKTGIGTVDGATNGVWFSPVAGQNGQFVIQGCGFGNTPGRVYLSAVPYDPSPSNRTAQPVAIPVCPGCVSFRIEPNGWNDRQILADIDPNASGFYDTNHATLVVRTASGQVYQAPGMNFQAVRADQVLTAILTPSILPGIQLVKVSDSQGEVIPPYAASPSFWGKVGPITISVQRERAMSEVPSRAYTFASGKDTYHFQFAPGFQLDPHILIDLWHSSVDASFCQSVGGIYASTGPQSWGLNYLSTSSFEVYWGVDSCWPPPPRRASPSRPGNPLYMLNFASVSGYALRITVLGPRGASPWAGGKVNPLGIKQLQPALLLKKH